MIHFIISAFLVGPTFGDSLMYEVKAQSPVDGQLLREVSSPRGFEFRLCDQIPSEPLFDARCEKIGLGLPNTDRARAALAKHFAAQLNQNVEFQNQISKQLGKEIYYGLLPLTATLTQFSFTEFGRHLDLVVSPG